MKLFKHFTYSEMKEICNKLEHEFCYFRHPQTDFINYLGKETVDKLIDINFLKDSPSTEASWDYKEDCYEFTKKFRRIFNFMTTPFWLWMKIYVFHWYIVKHFWYKLRIKCGHHYDWQDYEGVDINDI